MKQFYFLLLVFLFSVSLLKSQVAVEPSAEETYIAGEYHHLDGAFYFEMNEDGNLVLHWEGVHSEAGSNILCFQVLVSDISLIESGIDTWKGLAILFGNESSYVLPNLDSEHPLLYRLLAFYTNGEIAKSEVIDFRTLSDNKFLGNFTYSYENERDLIISWKAAGILPLYYIVASEDWEEWVSGSVTSCYIDQGRLHEGMYSVSVLAVYEDGEENKEEEALLLPYFPDMAPRNFTYEFYDENYLHFWWDPGVNDGLGYGIEHNGNLMFIDAWGSYYGWETYVDYNDFNTSAGKLYNYCDYSFGIEIQMDPDYTFFNYTHNIKTYMQHHFRLSLFQDEERGIRATNDLDYFILYGTPTQLKYSTESSEVYLYWENPVEGKLPYEYRIFRNGYELGSVSGEEHSFGDGDLPNGLYNYLIVAVYENDITIPSGIIQVAVNGSPVDHTDVGLTSLHFDYSIEGNNVMFNWAVEPSVPNPLYYRLECNKHKIPELPGYIQSYHDIYLPSGEYEYTIVAVYDDDSEVVSENTINISISSDGNDNPAKKIVRYSTTTSTFFAIPSCVDPDSISDLDRVTMISQEPLLENFEFRIDNSNQLKTIVEYPQQQRYENDHQYMVGKSITSGVGTVLYDHEGHKLAQGIVDAPYSGFVLSDEAVESFGTYAELFNIEPSEAKIKLSEAGFLTHEEEGLLVGVNDSMEVSIDFVNFSDEIQFFSNNQMHMSHRVEYVEVEGYILPVKETEITYSLLPSEISYQITKVKSYLSYTITEGESEDIVIEINEYKDEEGNPLHKSNNNQEIQQFEEIQKRETEIMIYPNPAEKRITIVFPFYMNENVEIKIYNMIGVEVLSQYHTKGKQITMDIHSLPAGSYVVRCVKNDKITSKIFVKQ